MSRRRSIGNLKVSGVSPKQEYVEKNLDELKTVGLKLNREEANQLIDLLNKAVNTQNWNYLNITGFRETKNVTVTYYEPV